MHEILPVTVILNDSFSVTVILHDLFSLIILDTLKRMFKPSDQLAFELVPFTAGTGKVTSRDLSHLDRQ
jgi:hypothetical protein